MVNFAFVPFEKMSFPEAMSIVFTGLVVVFAVLILLVLAFSLMGSMFAPKKEVKKETPVSKKAETPSKPAAPRKTPNNNLSVVAAITAALNEYLGAGNFIIKKIRPAKIGKKSSGVWGTEGKSENIKPF